jgi:hypothetical protein
MFRATRARLLEGARASSVTAARGSMCIVSHRCPREPVHCQSPLPTEGYVHLFRQSPLLKRACASSVTAARGSMCIVGHRCSREHVQPHSVSHRCSREHVHCWSLLPRVARAYLRQSPLLEGACASSPLLEERARQSRWSGMCELVRVRGCGSHGGAHAPPDHRCLRGSLRGRGLWCDVGRCRHWRPPLLVGR